MEMVVPEAPDAFSVIAALVAAIHGPADQVRW
jgi:hypothetical protein